MKVKKFKVKQIFKLHLLNSRAYEYLLKKSHPSVFTNYNLIELMGSFKRALHIIYQFHKAEKRILFVGIPKKLELKINRLTRHLAVSKAFDFQTIISKPLMFKLTERPDLIVLFSSEKRLGIINKSHAMRIPLINFGAKSASIKLLTRSSYQVELVNYNSNSASDKTLFFLGLNFLFKKL